jgi:hypothetical protein
MATRSLPFSLLVSMLPLAAVALGPASSIAGAWLPGQGDFYSEIRATYFSADTYRNADGDRVPLGGVAEQRELVSYSEFGWWKRGTFVIAIPATSITLRDDSGVFERTETGLSDLLLGMRVGLLDGPAALSIEADWKAPLGYDRRLTPRLGDGQQDLSGLLQFGASLEPVNAFIDLAGGYRYRADDPADQIVARADVGFWVGSSLLVAGRYQGALASGDGETPADETSVHLAGPVFVWRVDEFLDVFAGSVHSAAGENVLHADQFYVGIATRKTRLDRLQGFLGGTRRP